MYILAATEKKIMFIQILLNELFMLKEISFNKAKVLEFSNGGHFYAVSNDKNIQIMNFLTANSTPELIFNGHNKQGIPNGINHDCSLYNHRISKISFPQPIYCELRFPICKKDINKSDKLDLVTRRSDNLLQR